MLEKIKKDMVDRMSYYTSSLQPTDDEVSIAWLIDEVEHLNERLKQKVIKEMDEDVNPDKKVSPSEITKIHTETIHVHLDETELLVEFKTYEGTWTIINIIPIGIISEAIDMAIKKCLEMLAEHTPIVDNMCEDCGRIRKGLLDKTEICTKHKHPIDLPCVKTNEVCHDHTLGEEKFKESKSNHDSRC